MDSMVKKLKKANKEAHINHQIEHALVINLYQQAKLGFIASLLCFTIVLLSFILTNLPVIALYWYGFAVLIIAFRYLLVEKFFHIPTAKNNISLWRNLFTIGAFLNGACWGLIGTPLFLPHSNDLEQTLLLVILAGIAAGAVPLLSYARTAAIAFLTPALVPLIIYFYIFKEDTSILLATAITIFYIYLIILCLKTYNTLKNSIRLRFENVYLLKTLSKAKYQLEISNKKLAESATHDPLTNMGNRNLFVAKFIEAINHSNKTNKILALLYIDIDKFKWVNDLYGHQAGDQLLLEIVKRITSITASKDMIYRMGGDEFTILLEDIKDPLMIADYAKQICDIVALPIKINDVEILVNASIGISIYPIDGTDVDSLIKVADNAMYYVKKNGGNSYHFNVQLEST
jgi:diguanylate cyclase (GGDEF)-like protein